MKWTSKKALGRGFSDAFVCSQHLVHKSYSVLLNKTLLSRKTTECEYRISELKKITDYVP